MRNSRTSSDRRISEKADYGRGGGRSGSLRRLPHKTGQAHGGQHEHIHERDLQHRAERGVSAGAVGVVLRPVAHADDGGDAVDHQQAGADLQRLTEKGQDYVILDNVKGRGQYVGTYMALTTLERYWYGEGE